MNTNIVIGIVVALVLAGGGGYAVYTSMQNETTTELSAQTQQQQQLVPSSDQIRGTFATLFGLGQDLRCEFSYNDGTTISSGTTYIAKGGERIRGDFMITNKAAGPMEAHLIRDNGYHYMWGTLMGQGIQMKIEEGQEGQLFTDDAGEMPIDENTEYTCMPWAMDQSLFAIPADIEFMDLSTQMDSMLQLQGSFEGSVDMSALKAQQCAACAQIPSAEAQAQCTAALQCE